MAALFVQITIEIGRGLREFYFDREQQRAVLEKLRLQIREMRLRCQEAEQGKLVWNGCRNSKIAMFGFLVLPPHSLYALRMACKRNRVPGNFSNL